MKPSFINRKTFILGILSAGCFSATALPVPDVGAAQMDKVKASLTTLQAKTAKLGAPGIEGDGPIAGKNAPVLYFGTTKMNNNFDVADEDVKEQGGTATLFVRSSEELRA
jgi:hypothetical protein